MPIQSCSDDGKPGFKWGDTGKCYTYTPGSEFSRKEARRKALAQGIAIGDVDIERGFGVEIDQDYIYTVDEDV
jgi:hypothetical protein